ncbi:MAG: hydroxyacylglutathione hydrolase [Pseudomonadota bacterium]
MIQFPCLQDNYGFLIREGGSGIVAAVDTPDAEAISQALEKQGWKLDLILNTHWHWDHTGGNEVLKARYGARIIGPAAEGDRIPGRDRAVEDGDLVELGDVTARVLATPGHTVGHICYLFDDLNLGFVGDTLFSLGCGRLFEGTPEQMWSSLSSLRDLPADTTLYCAHEYTEANARFTESLGEANAALSARIAEIKDLRAKGAPTVPMTLGTEQATNPFLRADHPALQAAIGASDDPAAVFAEIRKRKDSF